MAKEQTILYDEIILPPNLPHIFNGASSSNKIGWLRKISLDFKHNPLISDSVNCTFFPGLDPRTENREIHFNVWTSSKVIIYYWILLMKWHWKDRPNTFCNILLNYISLAIYSSLSSAIHHSVTKVKFLFFALTYRFKILFSHWVTSVLPPFNAEYHKTN